MASLFKRSRWLVGLALVLLVSLGACSREEPLTDESFIGKWHSSRASSPILLDKNGEWALLAADGEVKEFGVWQYFDKKIMWSYMIDENMRHDINNVLSANAKEFKLRERDGSVTVFRKLE